MMRKTIKGDNSVMDFESFQKVNQVIYTLDTICDHSIMRNAEKGDNSVMDFGNFT